MLQDLEAGGIEFDGPVGQDDEQVIVVANIEVRPDVVDIIVDPAETVLGNFSFGHQ